MKNSNFSADYSRSNFGKLAPRADFYGKKNWTLHTFVNLDGTTDEVVRLNVLDDRHRENIIGFHFLKQYAELLYRNAEDAPQFYVTGRDCPWDFEYVMHDSTTFFVEICRIADENLLKIIRRENDCTNILGKGVIKGFEALKVEKNFPGTIPKEILKKIRTKADKEKSYDIRKFGIEPKFFIRPPMWPKIDLKKKMMTEIIKKQNKRHNGKERTILVLDNLITHSSIEEFFEVVESMQDFLESVTFPSIWLYTGYYSDNFGHECEFTFLPIKLSLLEESAVSLLS
jgi:hypothetical protein